MSSWIVPAVAGDHPRPRGSTKMLRSVQIFTAMKDSSSPTVFSTKMPSTSS